MDNKTTAIIIMAVIILIGASIYAYQNIQEKSYNQGVQDATLIINQQILNSLKQSGYVPFVFTDKNQTYNIKLGVIQDENE